MVNDSHIVDQLLDSPEPSVQWKVRTKVFGEERKSPLINALEAEIRESDRVRKLLSNRNADGQIVVEKGVYAKWQGAQWALSTLADIGYPAGDDSLQPIADQLLDQWLGPEFFAEFETDSKSKVYGKYGVPLMQGRYRRCGSQQSNALWTILTLAG